MDQKTLLYVVSIKEIGILLRGYGKVLGQISLFIIKIPYRRQKTNKIFDEIQFREIRFRIKDYKYNKPYICYVVLATSDYEN